MQTGTRNRTLFRIGCALRRFGADAVTLRVCLDAFNQRHATAPLASEEVAGIVASATRYAAGTIVPAKTGAAR